MFRLLLRHKWVQRKSRRNKHTSTFIRNSFINYFVDNHSHKFIKSSSVFPLCDPTIPFVNAGMNQFKPIFLGKVDPPCARAVNSQKCIRVGGKHNDLEVVGTDGYHHTFFEMLGNWSFADYYKEEACKMAWDLLLGPYRLKPEKLVVTYFSGDTALGLQEDVECRDIWKKIGVSPRHIIAQSSADNFWEMGEVGPCGPCTEIHHVNTDGTLTEIWNIVFIQYSREDDGSIRPLKNRYVDTGMGLERLTAILQNVESNYDTDLFKPIIEAIEKNSSGVEPYNSGPLRTNQLDCAYRRLADHIRMIAVCLADGVFPSTSLNLKQIIRRTFRMSNDIFKNPNLPLHLYDAVASTLGEAYPELVTKSREAKLVIEQEQCAYSRMRRELSKKWMSLSSLYPEVEVMQDVELSSFPLGYKEFKETMSKLNTTEIPGSLMFKLYDTHGFQIEIIHKIAQINNYTLDTGNFEKLLSNHRARHKSAFKEQNSQNKASQFEKVLRKLIEDGHKPTNDTFKYEFTVEGDKIHFEPLKTKLIAVLNEESESTKGAEASKNKHYYLVTENTNFFCEEGGQLADRGVIEINKNVTLNIIDVFKIKDYVFHKGFITETIDTDNIVIGNNVIMKIDEERRISLMRNHTAVHLLNAALRRVLPDSVICPVGSSVTDKGLSLTLSIYGEKLSPQAVLKAQDLIRESIKANVPVATILTDSVAMSQEDGVITLPGETYPEIGIRLVCTPKPLVSKEPCCGTHSPSTGFLEEFCVTSVKAAGSHAPTVRAITGPDARMAREVFCNVQRLDGVCEFVDTDRRELEVAGVKRRLSELCGGGAGGGAPYGDYAQCLATLDNIQKRNVHNSNLSLHEIAEAEVTAAKAEADADGRAYTVHFVRCSYLLPSGEVGGALRRCARRPPGGAVMLLGCAGGVVAAVCRVEQELAKDAFTAERWMKCILPVFKGHLESNSEYNPVTYSEMAPTKVSLITCEQLVQDAMRVAIQYARAHAAQDSEGRVNPRAKQGG